jgi:hypothetical protein
MNQRSDAETEAPEAEAGDGKGSAVKLPWQLSP